MDFGIPKYQDRYLINIKLVWLKLIVQKERIEALDYQPYPGDIGKKIMKIFSRSLANVDGPSNNAY